MSIEIIDMTCKKRGFNPFLCRIEWWSY